MCKHANSGIICQIDMNCLTICSNHTVAIIISSTQESLGLLICQNTSPGTKPLEEKPGRHKQGQTQSKGRVTPQWQVDKRQSKWKCWSALDAALCGIVQPQHPHFKTYLILTLSRCALGLLFASVFYWGLVKICDCCAALFNLNIFPRIL